MTYTSTWLAVAAFALVAVLIPVGMVVVSTLIRPRVEEQGKSEIYESGEVPTGAPRVRYNIQYYMVALVFLVFDVETAFIIPWVVIYRDAVAEVGLATALVPMLVFLGTLLAALAWAWRVGALSWVRAESPRSSRRSNHEQ